MFKNKFLLCISLVFSLGNMAPIAFATEKSTEQEAIALLKRAQDYIKTNGIDKSIVEFNKLDSPFNSKSDINPKGDLYLYSVDAKGYQAIHGKNPKIVGKVMLEMRDSDGVYIIKELAQCVAKGNIRVSYRWPNPVTKNLEAKIGYAEKIPGQDFCLGTGWYK